MILCTQNRGKELCVQERKFRTHVVELLLSSLRNGDDYHRTESCGTHCGNIKPQRLNANIAKDYHTPTICIRNKGERPVGSPGTPCETKIICHRAPLIGTRLTRPRAIAMRKKIGGERAFTRGKRQGGGRVPYSRLYVYMNIYIYGYTNM